MSTSLGELCQRARPELACLGELGRPLLDVVTVVERRAAGRDRSVLADPVFALDVLTAAGPESDAAVVGRVLDFLRARSGTGPVGPVTTVPTVTVAEAVESYERGALALMAKGTQHTYRTWTRRLVADYGDHGAGSVTAGDLTDLVAKHVVAGGSADDRRRSGRGEDLLKAHGKIDFRFPVVDHQEAELRPKIQSKMTVASFLAGFVSAALVSTLFVDEFTARRQVAAVLLTLALALFVITVYVYDELSMPEGFWLSGRRSALRRRLEGRQERHSDLRWNAVANGREADAPELDEVRWIEDEAAWRHARADEDAAQVEHDGPLYTWMVGTWRWAFTPALLFALVGFWLITFDAGSAATAIGSVLAIAIAVLWLTLRRPPLGTD